MQNGDDDGQLHFVRVQVDDFVLGELPHGIDAEPVRVTAIVTTTLQVVGGAGVVVAARLVTLGDEHARFHAFNPFAGRDHVFSVVDHVGRPEDVHRFGENVVVDQPRVDGEDGHHQDHVAAAEEDVPHLFQFNRYNFLSLE